MRLGYSVFPDKELKEWGEENGIEKWYIEKSNSDIELPELEKLCKFLRNGDEIGVLHSNGYVKAIFNQIIQLEEFSKINIQFAESDYSEEAISFISKVFGTIEAKLDTLKDDIDIEEDGHKYISIKQPEKKGTGHWWYVVKKSIWNKYLEYYKNYNVSESKLITLMARKFGISEFVARKWIINPDTKYFID